jgi:hypothetical protein
MELMKGRGRRIQVTASEKWVMLSAGVERWAAQDSDRLIRAAP